METRMKQAALASTSGSRGDVEPLVQPLIVDGAAKLYDQFRKEKGISYKLNVYPSYHSITFTPKELKMCKYKRKHHV